MKVPAEFKDMVSRRATAKIQKKLDEISAPLVKKSFDEAQKKVDEKNKVLASKEYKTAYEMVKAQTTGSYNSMGSVPAPGSKVENQVAKSRTLFTVSSAVHNPKSVLDYYISRVPDRAVDEAFEEAVAFANDVKDKYSQLMAEAAMGNDFGDLEKLMEKYGF